MPTSLIHFSRNNPAGARREKAPAGADGKRRGRRSAHDWYARRRSTKKFRRGAFCFSALPFLPTLRCPSLCHPQLRRSRLDLRALRVRDHGKTRQCTNTEAQRTRMPIRRTIRKRSRAEQERLESSVLPKRLGGA